MAQPISGMADTAMKASSLAELFLFIVLLAFFKAMVKHTQKYCYQDWMNDKFTKRRDSTTKEVRHFVYVPRNSNGTPYPGWRHCTNKERKKYKITTGYIFCWFAVLTLQGAHFGAYMPPTWKL